MFSSVLGLYIAFFNPDTVDEEGPRVAFYSSSTNTIELVSESESQTSVLRSFWVSRGIKDIELFQMGKNLYLALARDDTLISHQEKPCYVFRFANKGVDSEFILDSSFNYPARRVEFFGNSFGSYLMFVNPDDETTVHVNKFGSFVQIITKATWGSIDQELFRVQTTSSSSDQKLPDQDLIMLSDGPRVSFLSFQTPNEIVQSDFITLPATSDGVSPQQAVGLGKLADGKLYVFTHKPMADGDNFKMELHEVVTASSSSSLSELSHLVNEVAKAAAEVEELSEALTTLNDDLTVNTEDLDLIPLDQAFSHGGTDGKTLQAASITITNTLSSLSSLNVEVYHSVADANDVNFSALDYNDDTAGAGSLTKLLNEATTDTTSEHYIFR